MEERHEGQRQAERNQRWDRLGDLIEEIGRCLGDMVEGKAGERLRAAVKSARHERWRKELGEELGDTWRREHPVVID